MSFTTIARGYINIDVQKYQTGLPMGLFQTKFVYGYYYIVYQPWKSKANNIQTDTSRTTDSLHIF